MSDAASPMFWVTAPDGSCTFLSDSWYAFTGQTPETALGFGWLDATHPDDRELSEQLFRTANARHEPFRVDYRLRHREGGYRWAIDAASPRLAPDGTFLGFVGAVLDISERKRTEEALREGEARFRALFTSIDEGYCLCEIILDDAGRPVDYRFLEANPLFESMTGLVAATGRTALELVPDLESHWLETYGAVALGGEPLRFEQGSEAMGRWFDVFATPVEPRGRFALVFQDISRRKRAEETLRRSEAAERRARQQAELLAEIDDELDAADGPQERVERLVDLLVPRVADVASVVVPGEPDDVAALAPRGADPAALGTDDALIVPLDLGVGAAGALRLARVAAEPFGEEDAAFARRVAERASVVFTRARLREEEHSVVLRLQQALLPGALPVPPGVEVAARYEAGGDLLEVGGDWYDTIALPGGRLGLAVGDVVGHGVEAAAAMGRLRTALAALAPHAEGPGRLLSHLDAYTTSSHATEFATACCAMLDPATGALRYASAGHPPMLVVAPDGATAWLDGGRSAPLIGRAQVERVEAEATIAPGALLVLYSDGLVERRGEHLATGLARLEAAARAARDLPADAVCDRLLETMGVDVDRDDDVVVLCLRLTAAAAGARLHRDVPADPRQLATLRRAVRAWLTEHDVPEAQGRDVLLALGEACTNAIEHAYHEAEPGRLELELRADGAGDVHAAIHDFGSWRAQTESGGTRGRGTGIMRTVATDFARTTDPDGTTVTFRVPARRSPPR